MAAPAAAPLTSAGSFLTGVSSTAAGGGAFSSTAFASGAGAGAAAGGASFISAGFSPALSALWLAGSFASWAGGFFSAQPNKTAALNMSIMIKPVFFIAMTPIENAVLE